MDMFAGNEGSMVWLMTSTVLVWMIIPGIALLYGGLARRKAAVSLLFQGFAVCAVGSFQYFFWGYSLAYASTATSPFIGNLSNIGLRNVLAGPTGYLPELVFMLYQAYFAVCTTMLMVGGLFERARLLPTLILAFFWQTIVYCPISHWTWTTVGWLNKMGALDFAGGGPVHIASGSASLACAVVLGVRHERGTGRRVAVHRPHNVTLVCLGTIMIWFGWYGFNGGSTLALNIKSIYAMCNTGFAASAGVIGSCTFDLITRRRFSLVSACEGVIAGLVAITPAAGYVPLWSSWIIGFVTAMICAACGNLNDFMRVDEGLQVFKLHGIGGMLGSIFTGLFAADYVVALDGTSAPGGWVSRNWIQLGYQLADLTSIAAYSFVVTALLLYILNFIPGMRLRVSAEDEIRGLDYCELKEETVGDWDAWHNETMTPPNGSFILGHALGRHNTQQQAQKEAAQEEATPPQPST